MLGSCVVSALKPKFDGNCARLISQPGVRYTQPSSPCAMSSLFRSVQVNGTEIRASGLYRCAPELASPVVREALYLLSEYLSAVLPLPNTSYARPKRGAGSCWFGTFGVSGYARAGTKRPAGDD